MGYHKNSFRLPTSNYTFGHTPTVTSIRILLLLRQEPYLELGELCNKLKLSRSAMAKATRHLVDAGYVKRARGNLKERDERKYYYLYSLTPFAWDRFMRKELGIIPKGENEEEDILF